MPSKLTTALLVATAIAALCRAEPYEVAYEGDVFPEQVGWERFADGGGADVVGAMGRMADTQTHIFRISTEPVGFEGMFTADGSEVKRDAAGRAAVTVDFVCLRCHNEATTTPFALTIDFASKIAIRMHGGSG